MPSCPYFILSTPLSLNMWTYFSISAFAWGQARSKIGGVDTSILPHAFISIFVALWAIITHYVTIKKNRHQRWRLGGPHPAHEGGGRNHPLGRAPTLVATVWPPSGTSCTMYFYIFWKWLPWSFRTFGAMHNRSLIFVPFPAQNPSCRHSPSLCKPCKIRENRHKYCDIMCNNNP